MSELGLLMQDLVESEHNRGVGNWDLGIGGLDLLEPVP